MRFSKLFPALFPARCVVRFAGASPFGPAEDASLRRRCPICVRLGQVRTESRSQGRSRPSSSPKLAPHGVEAPTPSSLAKQCALIICAQERGSVPHVREKQRQKGYRKGYRIRGEPSFTFCTTLRRHRPMETPPGNSHLPGSPAVARSICPGSSPCGPRLSGSSGEKALLASLPLPSLVRHRPLKYNKRTFNEEDFLWKLRGDL